MLNLSKLIGLTGLDVMAVSPSQLPPTKDQELSDSLPYQIPVYGDLLVYEKNVLEGLAKKVVSHLNKFFKLFTLLNYVPDGYEALSELITQLQQGYVVRVTDVTVDFDPEFWRKETLDSLLTDGHTLANGGLNNFLEENYVTWAEATGVYIPAQLLQTAIDGVAYKVNITEQVDVDAQQLLKDCQLTWAELYGYQDLLTPELEICVLLCLRTGIWNQNPMDTLLAKDADILKAVLRKEIGPEPEKLISNPNVVSAEGKEALNNGVSVEA
jgi:hypothetical protein